MRRHDKQQASLFPEIITGTRLLMFGSPFKPYQFKTAILDEQMIGFSIDDDSTSLSLRLSVYAYEGTREFGPLVVVKFVDSVGRQSRSHACNLSEPVNL